MGIVADFHKSDDLGWEVTRDEFMTKILDEIVNFPEVLVVIKGTQTYLINRAYVKVKVVIPNNGGSAESEL